MGAGLLHKVTGIALGLLRRSSGTVPSEQEVTSMEVCLGTRSKISLASLAVRASLLIQSPFAQAQIDLRKSFTLIFLQKVTGVFDDGMRLPARAGYQFLKDGPIRRAASGSCEA
jgi:hypothetical protein